MHSHQAVLASFPSWLASALAIIPTNKQIYCMHSHQAVLASFPSWLVNALTIIPTNNRTIACTAIKQYLPFSLVG
jgi:hypothetical protein